MRILLFSYISVNAGIARTTHMGYDIEAPDYDRRGHFYPNVHEEDIMEEVEHRYPQASQRDMIRAILHDHNHHEQNDERPLGRPIHYHTHLDDDDDDDD